MHLVVWVNDVPPRELGPLIARVARAGVGIYSVASSYTEPPRRADLLFGYAALTEGEIRAGVRRLADLLEAGPVRPFPGEITGEPGTGRPRGAAKFPAPRE